MSELADLFPVWQRQALCIGFDGGHWFPVRGESTKLAKEICQRCPVRAECLEYALTEGIHHGIWGGTSERERRRMRTPSAGRP